MDDLLQRLQDDLSGRYEVVRELGAGGMARVFLASDLRHDTQVAIKVLRPELAAIIGTERFHREIAIIARLEHPHIIPLLESGVAAGAPFYSMSYVEGESLRSRLDRERQLPLEEATRLAATVARALDYAHRHGVVHRDIKPENILLSDGKPMVADFGIARAVGTAGGQRITQSGVVLGTAPYMSPEQASGDAMIDGRTDVYALGCVLYEMIAGQAPFTGPTTQSIVYQHINVPPRSVRELRPTAPAALDSTILRALGKSAADRFSSGAMLADALDDVSESEGATGKPLWPVRVRRIAARRSHLAIWFTSLTALLLLAAIWGGWRAGWFPRWSRVGGDARQPRQWVLLADFGGPADDPELAVAARAVVGASLDQSPSLATVPDEQVRLALNRAGQPDSSRLVPVLAREIATRSWLPFVVEGEVRRLASGYAVVLRVVEPDDGRVIRSVSEGAPEPRGLMSALDRAARTLRTGLGKGTRSPSVEAPLSAVLTSSFDAFRRYARADRLIGAGRGPEAVSELKEALLLDPDFTSARYLLGVAYNLSGMRDSAIASLTLAQRRPERLGPLQRVDLKGLLSGIRDGQYEATIEDYRAVLREDVGPYNAATLLHNLGTSYMRLDRLEEGLAAFRSSQANFPIEVPSLSRWVTTYALLKLNRLEEARVEAARIGGPGATMWDMLISLAGLRWARADSLAGLLQADPAATPAQRTEAAAGLASVRVVRGEITDAARILAAAEPLATPGLAQPGRETRNSLDPAWDRWWLAVLAGHDLPPAPTRSSNPSEVAFWHAVSAASKGDSRAVESELPRLASFYDSLSDNSQRDFFRGWARASAGRPREAVGLLTTVALKGRHVDDRRISALRGAARWLLADAYDRLEQPDSAATYFGRVLDPPGRNRETVSSRGMFRPFALRRLVLLEVELGRLGEARRHWEELASTCVHPDPDLAPRLDEARAALVRAETARTRANR